MNVRRRAHTRLVMVRREGVVSGSWFLVSGWILRSARARESPSSRPNAVVALCRDDECVCVATRNPVKKKKRCPGGLYLGEARHNREQRLGVRREPEVVLQQVRLERGLTELVQRLRVPRAQPRREVAYLRAGGRATKEAHTSLDTMGANNL